jgi:hypothetical protein
MAPKSTLNAKNLESLGAPRLAQLLLTLAQGDAAAKRVLRLALAEQRGPTEIAREVRKRLATIARSTSFLDGRQRNALLKELEQQRQAITGPIAEQDPALAVDLLWSFLEFHQATAELGVVAARAKADPQALADHSTT